MSDALTSLRTMSRRLDQIEASYREQAAILRETPSPATRARQLENARRALVEIKEIHFQTVENHLSLDAEEVDAARDALSHGRVAEVRQYFEREIAAIS